MAEREGLSLSITTKSNQVVRDIELLQRISERSSLTVNMSITTLRTRLARLLEPRAPRPDLRMEAVRKLREAGIAAGVFAMPVIPGLTDSEKDLDALAQSARDAGAQWLGGRVLFLMPSSWKTFQVFLESKFPKLAVRYRDWHKGYGDMPKEYRAKLATLFAELRRKHGLGSRPALPLTKSWKSPQLTLEMGEAR
jgi:DNA repair photolyase